MGIGAVSENRAEVRRIRITHGPSILVYDDGPRRHSMKKKNYVTVEGMKPVTDFYNDQLRDMDRRIDFQSDSIDCLMVSILLLSLAILILNFRD